MQGYHALRDTVQQMATVGGAKFAAPRLGLVTSYDPEAYAVKVEVQPEGVETGWCPIVTSLAGNGWGVYAGPSKGDQAVILFPEGDELVGACLGFLPSDEDRPPRVESGEVFLMHEGGAFLKFTEDGKIKSAGEWEHDGPFQATGEIRSRFGGVVAALGGLWDAFLLHVHPGVQTGGGSTQVTTTEPEA